MSITFISRTAAKPDEVTVRIYQDADEVLGDVVSPHGLEGSKTAAEADQDGALGVHQALASAIALAEQHGGTIGIVDEDGLWREEWGDLTAQDG